MFFQWLHSVYKFGEEDHGCKLSFSSHHIKGTCHQYDLSLLILTLVIWYSYFLPFSYCYLWKEAMMDHSKHVSTIIVPFQLVTEHYKEVPRSMPCPQFPENHCSVYCLYNFVFSKVSFKRNHALGSFFRLASLS